MMNQPTLDTLAPLPWIPWHRTRRIYMYRREGKGRRCCVGTELIQFLAALAIFHQDVLKERMNRIKATWRNRCFKKVDDHPVHTIPNHHPTKMDVLPQTLVQIILSAKLLVLHSSTSPQPAATTFAFSSVFVLLLCLAPKNQINLCRYMTVCIALTVSLKLGKQLYL